MHLRRHVVRCTALAGARAHHAHRINQPSRWRLLGLGLGGRAIKAVVQYPHLEDMRDVCSRVVQGRPMLPGACIQPES